MITSEQADLIHWTELCNDGPPWAHEGEIIEHKGDWVVVIEVEYVDGEGTDHDLAHYTARPATKEEAEDANADEERRRAACEAERAERLKYYDSWY